MLKEEKGERNFFFTDLENKNEMVLKSVDMISVNCLKLV